MKASFCDVTAAKPPVLIRNGSDSRKWKADFKKDLEK